MNFFYNVIIGGKKYENKESSFQLRIRDLESALELEKTSKGEVASGKDKLNKQLR